MHYINFTIGSLLLVLTTSIASAQILVDEGNKTNSAPVTSQQAQPTLSTPTLSQPNSETRVGEGAAQQYFKKRENNRDSESSAPATAQGVRYMAIQLGSFVSDTAYRWGSNRKDTDVGQTIFGVSYRIGEWINSADLLARIEYTQFDIDGKSPKKISFMPVISFPDAKSGFPLYFGAGAGFGIFLNQIAEESNLTLDYNIHAGARFMNMFPNGGVLIETGLRGHYHLLSSGQFDGVYVSVGGAFIF